MPVRSIVQSQELLSFFCTLGHVFWLEEGNSVNSVNSVNVLWSLVFDGMLVGMWHPKFMWTLYVVLIFIGFALSAHGVFGILI